MACYTQWDQLKHFSHTITSLIPSGTPAATSQRNSRAVPCGSFIYIRGAPPEHTLRVEVEVETVEVEVG